MSAWADEPERFRQGGRGRGHERGRLRAAPARSAPICARSWTRRRRADWSTVVRRERPSATRDGDGWTVDAGRRVASIEARALVLAHGNQPPEPTAVARGISPELFVNNPWSDEGARGDRAVAASDGDVLLLGTGLTMVDVVLSWTRRGHRGRIVALSRRGQMPRGPCRHEPAPVELDEVPQGNVLALWRWLRRRGARGRLAGGGRQPAAA